MQALPANPGQCMAARLVQGGRRLGATEQRGVGCSEIVPAVAGGGGGMTKIKDKPKNSTEAVEAFRAADTDGNQLLDQEELKQALKAHGTNMSDEEFSKAFKAMDVNGDGRVDLGEFEAAIGTREREDRGSSNWVLTPDIEDRLNAVFIQMAGDKDRVLEEGDRGAARQALTVLLMDFGMSAGVFDGLGGLTFPLFRDRFLAEWEVTRKRQALASADLLRAAAEALRGGGPDAPLESLEGMSDEEIAAWVRGGLASNLDRVFAAERDKLKQKRALLSESVREEGGGNAKFRTATFGDIQAFHSGLAGQIGLPHPRLGEGLESEHCRRDDSHDDFSPGNYDTITTPFQEYKVVTDAAEGGKASTGARKIRSVAELKKHKVAEQAGLRDEEILALLLYTGPMYVKYNAVLRGFPQQAVDGLKGNSYTTTIYLIVSGIIKLSRHMRIPEERMVFRGLGGLELPEAFVRADEHGVRGGVEFAMMSTTLDRNVALQYAGKELPTVFEINVGAIDRGASLVWLSQYPAEEEILLPPRSYLEVVGLARFEVGPDGRMIRVVTLKVNANVTSSTIEEIESRRKDLFLSAADNALFDIKSRLSLEVKSPATIEFLSHRPFELNRSLHVKLADSIVAEVEGWVSKHRGNAPEFYNDEWQYAAAVRDLTRLEAAAMDKWNYWAIAKAGAAEPLSGEPIERVTRLQEGLMNRQLGALLAPGGGGGEGGEGGARGLALEMCRRRGAVVRSVEETNHLGEPAFVAAAAGGHAGNLRLLLAAGADVNTRTDKGVTALHVACTMGHLDYARALIDAGADVGAMDEEGVGCAYRAAVGGQLDVLSYLYERGGKDILMVTTGEGKPVITGAAAKGYLDVVKFLFEKGGKDLLLSVDKDNCTCAYNAASQGRVEVLSYLWEVGGKPLFDVQNRKGRTLAVAAAQNGHVEALKFLEKKLGREFLMVLTTAKCSAAYWAARTGQLETVQWLTETCGVEILNGVQVAKTGETCAHIVADRGHFDVLKYIFEKCGRDLFLLKESKTGNTALSLAEAGGHAEIVRWLKEEVKVEVE